MMEHFDDFVTDRAIHLDELRAHAASDKEGTRFLSRYWVSATSGSSGHPGFFLFDEDEWASIMASFARGQEWSGVNVNLTQRTRMATVASISP
jgi:phenylacetate-CoA ligase